MPKQAAPKIKKTGWLWLVGPGLILIGWLVLFWNRYRVGNTVCAPDCAELGRSSHLFVILGLLLIAVGVVLIVIGLVRRLNSNNN
jgi:uncharacterized membrane protein